jgi:sugar phosphate isomerase/epimerase
MSIGIQLYTVKDALQNNVSGTLKQLRAIGYTIVESCRFKGYDAGALRAAIDEAGLKCPSSHLPMNGPDLGSALAEAHILGANYVVSSIGSTLPTHKLHGPDGKLLTLTSDTYKDMAEIMNDVGKKAKQDGLKYAYHNHYLEFQDLGGGKVGFDILMRETDPFLVDFEFDCGWFYAAGYSPIPYLKKYPHRCKMLHIKDFNKEGARTPATHPSIEAQGTELGRGGPDYEPIFAAAASAGILHYFVEQEPPFLEMTSLEAAKVDYDYLHTL